MLATFLSAAASLFFQAPTLELTDHTAIYSTHLVHSITTDGDTAYVCQGATVFKMVFGKRLEIVDSLPNRDASGWNDAKYVHLGEGIGMLAYVDFPFSDTAVWLVDWNRPSRSLGPGPTSRWAAYLQLPKGEGFTFASRLTGQHDNLYTGVFGSDKGLLRVSVFSSKDAERLVLTDSLGYTGAPVWADHSLGASALSHDRPLEMRSLAVLLSGGRTLEFYQATHPYNRFSLLTRFASHELMDSVMFGGTLLSAPEGSSWLYVPRWTNTALLLRKPTASIGLDIRDIRIPKLISDLGRGSSGEIVAARSDEGLDVPYTRSRYAALAGDSLLAVYAWDGTEPSLLVTEEIRHQTRALAFGDTVLWQADKGEIHAWRLSEGTASARPRVLSPARWVPVWSRDHWTLHGQPGEEVSLSTASGRRLAKERIGSDGTLRIPARSQVIVARSAGRTFAIPPAPSVSRGR
ncbi:MAG TPA: hypothetical protein PKO15_11445 [Fibrobacteria bacterium]|nr:hypothetical protein [Fibrobacteria bacterium]HOX51522.1 hypothetical protein [Fibrobacteria bacterium]